MRELGHRWGLVVVLLGLPILARGLSEGEAVATALGSSLLFCGLVIWGCLRSRRKMSSPEH
jgi:hypothetical protein